MGLLAFAAVLGGGTAGAQPEPPPPAPVPPAKAWIVVDADTGAVLDAGNARTLMLTASVVKVLTAVVVEENLPPGADVTVSERAQGMPAAKINLKAGQVWRSGDLLQALLLVSANDAAVALAEQTAGSVEAFAAMLDRTAARIGMADKPVLRDPAGLDNEFSVNGGNLVSARDLAVATRLFLSYPRLAAIAAGADYHFQGGDGQPHRILNHNRLLKTYPGAVGVKTGYTRRAGRSLIAAARRDGRTLIAVVIAAPDRYAFAAALLDRGFASPAQAGGDADRLPAVVRGNARDPITNAPPPPRPVSTPHPQARTMRPWLPSSAAALLGALGVTALVRLSQERRVRSRGAM